MAPDYPAKGKKPSKKESPKAALARAVDAFTRLPFPERSTDDAADILHAELLLFDSAVGDTLLTILNGDWVPREEVKPNSDLRQQLTAQAESDNPTAAADARSYLEYLDALETLLELASAVVIKHPKK
jgi:hypothetical protein